MYIRISVSRDYQGNPGWGHSLRITALLASLRATAKIDCGSALHMFGLVSDGGVHSHNDASLRICWSLLREQGYRSRVYVHGFLDGRDTPPACGKGLCSSSLEAEDEESSASVKLQAVMGRYEAMDRDNRWDRVEACL